MQELTYKYYRKRGVKIVYMILHGGGPVGVETDFISSIFDAIAATKNSVLCFNFPYCEREEEASSGPELKEERWMHSSELSILLILRGLAKL